MTTYNMSPGGGVSNHVQRRGLLAGAGLLAVGAAVSAPMATQPPLTPIVIAGMRLAELSALKERNLSDGEYQRVTEEQLLLQERIVNTKPEAVADAVVLLMAASCDAGVGFLHDDGAFSYERANILILRVMRFLAADIGINPDDIGGTFLLTNNEHQAKALTGTVAEAALRFHHVTPERAWTRHEEERYLTTRNIIREQHGIGFNSDGPGHAETMRTGEQMADAVNSGRVNLGRPGPRGIPEQEQELVDRLGAALRQLQARDAGRA